MLMFVSECIQYARRQLMSPCLRPVIAEPVTNLHKGNVNPFYSNVMYIATQRMHTCRRFTISSLRMLRACAMLDPFHMKKSSRLIPLSTSSFPRYSRSVVKMGECAMLEPSMGMQMNALASSQPSGTSKQGDSHVSIYAVTECGNGR